MLFGVRGTGGWGECLKGDGPLTVSARACIYRTPHAQSRAAPTTSEPTPCADGYLMIPLETPYRAHFSWS